MFLGTMFAVSGLIFAQDNPNLLKNSELKAGNDKSLSDWTVRGKFSQDAGYKGPNSISMILEKDKEGSGGRAVMTQWVGKLKPGKYIFSAYIKMDRKIKEVVLIRFFMIDGKNDYQGTSLKAPDQPEPGVWGKAMAELDIPEGYNEATFAFDLRDESPGAAFWIDSPVLIYKAGQ